MLVVVCRLIWSIGFCQIFTVFGLVLFGTIKPIGGQEFFNGSIKGRFFRLKGVFTITKFVFFYSNIFFYNLKISGGGGVQLPVCIPVNE